MVRWGGRGERQCGGKRGHGGRGGPRGGGGKLGTEAVVSTLLIKSVGSLEECR